jgi:hypothetical protein
MNSDLAPAIVMMVISISIATVIILRGPVGKALGRRIEGGSPPDSDLVQRVEELETRLLAAEQVEARLAEVEERLDFTERLLAKERKVAQIHGEL